MNIRIDSNKCNGCGLCVKVCSQEHLELQKGRAHRIKRNCFGCGHCVAVCPANAVSSLELQDAELKEYNSEEFDIDPSKVLNTICFRRSVRIYKEEPLTKEQIQMILDAGRYSPTGGNEQELRFIVIQNCVPQIAKIILESLYFGIVGCSDEKEAAERLFKGNMEYVKMIKTRYQNSMLGKKDSIFHNAPCVIAIIGPAGREVEAGIAAANMEMTAVGMGLGTCYVGFARIAAIHSQALQQIFRLGEECLLTCFTVGNPAIRYQRTVPRAERQVLFL